MPKVSVIISTYNRAHLIGRSIKSVLNQTYQDFEIIVSLRIFLNFHRFYTQKF
ncbi:MAG: glycosyltransferase [Methanosarcinales archaeon]|nr:glycosyltransferase [Methanosarcinales archaeon]